MSHDVDRLLQCTCAALFATSDALNAHLNEYRIRDCYLSTQQEICRSHAKISNDDNDSDVYEDSARQQASSEYRCPFNQCNRILPFKTRHKLRRHFEQHIKCEEVCVTCHHVSLRVSDFVRHARMHQEMGTTKARYTQQMCCELRDGAEEELGVAERTRKKRTRDGGDTDSRTLQARKPRLHMVGMNEPGCQSNNFTSYQNSSLQAGFSSTQAATVPMPPSNVVGSVATNNFPDLSTEAFYPKSMEGPTTATEDINFDAPVNSILNFPESWWMGAEIPGNLETL